MGVIKTPPQDLREKGVEGGKAAGQAYCKDENLKASAQIPFGRFVQLTGFDGLAGLPTVGPVDATTTVDDIYGVSQIAHHEYRSEIDTLTSPGEFPAYAAQDAATVSKENVLWLHTTTAVTVADPVHVIIDGATNADELGRVRASADGTNTLALPLSMARFRSEAAAGELVKVKFSVL